MKKKILIIILWQILNFSVCFAEPKISEINFLEYEYLEVYSNQTFIENISKIVLLDENTNNQTFELLQEKNSNYFLFTGREFEENINYENLNCTIYISSGTSFGNYGLKNSGESFTLIINESLNLSYNNLESLNFEENFSLNFEEDIITKKLKTPCYNENQNETENGSDLENQSEQINNCENNSFEIGLEKIFFEDKIEFNFITNLENPNFEYFIENNGDIVKAKRTSTSKSKKSFTPKFSGKYLIKAKVSNQNCLFEDEKYVGYFLEEENFKDENSYINFLNKEKILNGSKNVLEIKIEKGNTLKKVVNFFIDEKKISSFKLETKFSKILAKVKIPKNFSKIEVQGLGIIKIIERNSSKNIIKENKKVSQIFEISNLKILDKEIKANINFLEEKVQNTSCKILQGRKQISVENIKINSSKNITLKINERKINEDPLKKLKLNCKYKKIPNKSFTYESKFFNFSKNFDKEKKLKNNFLEKNSSIKNNNFDINFFEKNFSSNKNSIYKSDGQKQKELAILPAFVALGTISSVLLFFW